MKEIKLRGFHKKRKQMHDIVMVDSENGLVALKMYDEDREEIYSEEELLKEVVLMLWTGLKDKNGVEIYEGDIVSYMDGHDGGVYGECSCIGRVIWDDETLSFQVTNRIEAESYEVLEDCRVIGNIYENHELIKDVTE